MGQVASAGDNAGMESSFSLLQKNVLNQRRWASRYELRLAIITWIERTYHRRRRQASLGRLTPIEYETIMTTPATRGAYPNLSPEGAAVPSAKVGPCWAARVAPVWRRSCQRRSERPATFPALRSTL